MQAIWNGEVIAESHETVVVEGNHYFPRQSVNMAFMRASETRTHCPWKGDASYYTLEVNGKVNSDAAWFYPEPKPAADKIKGRVAFWRGVEIRS